MLKSDVNKLKTVPVDLSRLSDLVANAVVSKTLYDEWTGKVNAIRTNGSNNLVTKADYDAKIDEIEKKVCNHDDTKLRTIWLISQKR